MSDSGMLRATLLTMSLVGAALVGPEPAWAQDLELDRQVRDVSAQLRCPVCRQQSIEESPSAMALEMKTLIREKLEAGQEPHEVIDYFVARYGEWVLLRPKASGFNLTVWLLPPILTLLGFWLVVSAFRRWTVTEHPELLGPDAR